MDEAAMSDNELTPEQWAQVRRDVGVLSVVEYPKEACGFLFVNDADKGIDSGVYVKAVQNVDDAPWYRFRISSADASIALNSGRCIGVWHSHPADPAVPSEIDEEIAQPSLYFIVYSVQEEDMGVFVKEGDRLVLRKMVMPAPEPKGSSAEGGFPIIQRTRGWMS